MAKNMMNIMLGVVSKVEDPNKFIIKFTVEGLIEDCIAYPIDTFDQPEVGDPIVLFGLENILGYSWMWQKQRHFDHTRLRHTNSVIEIKPEDINIITGSSSIKMNKDGSIEIKSSSTINVESPDITVKGSSSIEVKSPDVTITGGQLKTKGTANTDTMGPYCALKFCPYSGAPHVGSKVSGT